MKKILKFVSGVAVVAGVVCGGVYVAKKVLGIDDDFDDYDEDFDDDFEDDDDEEDAQDREYVTLDIDKEEAEEADNTETAEDEE